MEELGSVLLVDGHVWWNEVGERPITNTIVATMGSLMNKYEFVFGDRVFTVITETHVNYHQTVMIFKALVGAFHTCFGTILLPNGYHRYQLAGDYEEFYTYKGDKFLFKGWLPGYASTEPTEY